jgi:hypothetical protein
MLSLAFTRSRNHLQNSRSSIRESREFWQRRTRAIPLSFLLPVTIAAVLTVPAASAMNWSDWLDCLSDSSNPNTTCTLDYGTGTYNVTSEIPITRSNITVNGTPNGSTWPVLIRSASSLPVMLHVSGSLSGLSIYRLTIDGGQSYVSSYYNSGVDCSTDPLQSKCWHDIQVDSGTTVTFTNMQFQNSSYNGLYASTGTNITFNSGSFTNGLDVGLSAGGTLNVTYSTFTNNAGGALDNQGGPADIENNDFEGNQYYPPSGTGSGGQLFFVQEGAAMTVTVKNNTINGRYSNGGNPQNYGVELNCDPTYALNYLGQGNTIYNHTYSGYWIGGGGSNGVCKAVLESENIYSNQGSGITLDTLYTNMGTLVSMVGVDVESNPYNSSIGWSGYGVYFALSSTAPVCIDTASNLSGNGLGAFGGLSYMQQSSCPTTL